jgi:predicted outer membrane repeat protein
MRRTLSSIFIVLSIVTAFAAFGVPVDTKWTYQGQLRRSGSAYTGTCNFQFSLWDALGAGTQQGNTQSINSVNVLNGLFTVVLDFGDEFAGDARWLATSVQCSGDGGFTPLDPRQPLTAAPYALSLRPGARIEGFVDFEPMLFVNNSSAFGGAIIGTGKIGVFGSATFPDGQGVYGQGGTGANSAGVFGINTTSAAIWGKSTGTGPAIYGENTSTGYAGRFAGPVDVIGPLTATNTIIGVQGKTTGSLGTGVFGDARNVTDGYGVVGRGITGVYGEGVTGVFGETGSASNAGPVAAAVSGRSTGSAPGIRGENTSTGYAGFFQGNVGINGTGYVFGDFSVFGNLVKQTGSFRIDHPLDPEHKFLSHSFVESPDMMNIYNGDVTTDETGTVIVTLPAYFEALNRDYRYQLTVLGQFAQAIVSRKIDGNSFEIRTDRPGVEVSWQVTGIRQDAYARARPIVPEEFKPAEQQGMYIFPAGFGAGEEKQIGASSRPAPTQEAQGPTGASQRAQAPGK